MDEPTLYRRMTKTEDALWGLRQAGRRLERYVEDFLEHIDSILYHLTPRTSTYCPNGSDHLPKPKHPLILRSSTCILSGGLPAAVRGSPKPAVRGELKATICGEVTVAMRCPRKPAAVHGSRKPAGRHPRLTQACYPRGNLGRRSQPTQARCRSWLTQGRCSQGSQARRRMHMCPWDCWWHMRV